MSKSFGISYPLKMRCVIEILLALVLSLTLEFNIKSLILLVYCGPGEKLKAENDKTGCGIESVGKLSEHGEHGLVFISCDACDRFLRSP